jgi:hypothetical protein
MDPSVSMNPNLPIRDQAPNPLVQPAAPAAQSRPAPGGEDELFRDPFADFAPSSR